MMIRFHLLGSVQASETLQYKHGENTRKSAPISWTSPPNALQLRPWPNSWMIFTSPKANHKYQTVPKLKNSWYEGSLSRNASKWVATSMIADIMTAILNAMNHVVKIHRIQGSMWLSSLSGSKTGILM